MTTEHGLWHTVCRCVPMGWLCGVWLRNSHDGQRNRRSRLAYRIYIWFETRRYGEWLRNDYRRNGYDV